jgi:hypothetical protein
LRFLADGPWLPDELLVARDEGRVLFFCGAGVSRARAGLPNFIDLAKSVLRELHVLPESPAQKLIDAAEQLEPIAGVGGLLAADRIFGLLERDFAVADIERMVGAALKPQGKVDLSAHRTLLALSRDAAGRVQLVTTNFDLLFEAAAPNTLVWTPDRLPDLRRAAEFEGIVHLHGMFDPAYAKPVGGRLVLSSAEFGRAYLAEGWATNFFRAAIGNYLIVFVGYAADDPPVQYLLEALNRVADTPSQSLYAFQSGREEDAKALWIQKGVHAISYAPENDHAALWASLKAWANRARNPERWRERLIRRSSRGPQALQPCERGQIVHLAATEDGARSISQSKRVLPASWLSVFDPGGRYGQPGKANPMEPGSPDVDPFMEYGLDSDPAPPTARENQSNQRREVPTGVINVLVPIPLDRRTVGGRFNGQESAHASELPPRLISLAVWLGRVCGEPSAIWWAAGQAGLHPWVIQQIQRSLNQKETALPLLVRSAWHYLFESWKSPQEADYRAFALHDAITRDGWTRQHLRRFAEISRGILTTSRPYWVSPLPPRPSKRLRLRDLVNIEVHHPGRHIRFEIPNEHLRSVVALLRQNLEYIVDLQLEVNPFGLSDIVPIEPDPNLIGKASERDFGINLIVLEFVDLFRRLAQHDKAAALQESTGWRQSNDPLFDRLRIWTARLDNFLDDEIASKTLLDLDDSIFWGSRDQRDLLLTLRHRWQTMPAQVRAIIEMRLLAGRPAVKRKSAAINRQWQAHSILDRVTWLQSEGCLFVTDVEATLAHLRKVVPQWTPAEAAQATDSHESRGGAVRIDKSFGNLADAPISELIPRATQGRARAWGELQGYDPFAGLCEKRPVLVLAALRYELREGRDVVPAWRDFLYSAGRQSDDPKVAALIARRLANLPQLVLDAIIMPACYWLEISNERLYACDPDALYILFDGSASTLARKPEAAEPKPLGPNETRDWGNAFHGSAVGHLVNTLVGNPESAKIGPHDALPDAWLIRAERLLALPGNHGCFGLASLSRHLNWLYHHADTWSEKKIVAVMLEEGAKQDAALAGFLTNPTIYDQRLYRLLKPLLIQLGTSERHSQRRYDTALGRLFVLGWLTRTNSDTRWLADDEFRRVLIYGSEGLRTQVLWHVGHFEVFTEKIALLQKVWPLQVAIRTPVVVGQLCALALDDDTHFGELVDVILPLVSRADGGSLDLSMTPGKAGTIIRNYSSQALALLDAVLPDDVSRWSFGAGTILEQLIHARPTLVTDPRMIRLKRIWDRR